MAELGGMIAAAMLKVVGQQIGSVIEGQITLQKNFSKDLKQMKETLESVEALLKDAEKRSIMEEAVRLWLKRLKNAMYAISDMIDDFEAGSESVRKFSLRNHLAVMIPCLTIGPKFTMANRMKEMREELEEVTRQHKKFELVPGTSVDELKVLRDDRETSSTIQASIVGRTKDEDKIWASLSESITEDFTVLAIYGIGGLGKSTLAQMVYNNFSRFEDYTRVWIYVSQTLDLNKIGNSVITQLSGNESHYTDRQMINSTLAKRLAGKKIMIVLDDLWEENKVNLDGLIAMFKVGKGSKVVVLATTRNEEIARQISTIGPHKLASLTDDMCWTIIKQKSKFESKDDKEQLRHIGEHIAAKCGGVALAAQSLGHMLQDLKRREWMSVRDSDIWSVSASASDSNAAATRVFASLRLSYSFMHVCLKLCFAYCAIFPKGWKIYKDDLIHQWISLGFIEATETSSTWELGERYIRELLKLSFLDCSKDSTTARGHPDDVTSFTMHDLVHDLASAVMGDEILLADKHGNSGESCCHYALLSDCSKPLDSPRIRALCFMDSTEIGVNDAVFSSAKSMRVLELKQCSIHNLPDSIGCLKQLRYLNAPRVQNTVIPNSICSLTKLTYLGLRGSSAILALPDSVGEMEGLTYLDLSGCSGIRELPESFGELRKLVHLDLSSCSSLENISKFLGNLTAVQYLNLSECACIGDLPASLGSLSELQYLNLSQSSYVCGCTEAEVLDGLNKLEYLNLSSRDSCLKQLPEGLANFVNLKYLLLSRCGIKELPRSFGNLKGLVHLDLSMCDQVNFLPEAFDGLTSLQYLNLKMCFRTNSYEEVEIIIDRISTLSNLEHLDLSYSSIRYLPESLGNLRKLQTLDFSRTDVSEIPASIGTIDGLKIVYSGCYIEELPQFCYSSLTLPHFMVHAGDHGESRSNLVLLGDTNPNELEISRLENVKSVEEAEHIKLMEKEQLTMSLKLRWTVGAERFVDDEMLLAKLAPPSMIRILEIHGFNGVSLPAWVSQLPNLKLLTLSGMESLEEWSTSDSGVANDLIFPVIEELVIEDCPKLRMKSFLPRAIKLKIIKSDNVLSSWGEISSSSSSPVTAELEVDYSELPMQQWRLIRHLPSLTRLSISRCGDMTISSDIIRDMSSIEELILESKDQEDLPAWLGELTSLKLLSIAGYQGEKELDDNIRKLTKLQGLYLTRCDNMSSLPHWLIELTCLESLVIQYCAGIKSLPEGIQQLSNLKTLITVDCPDLEKWCKIEENYKTKLAHIKTKEFYK